MANHFNSHCCFSDHLIHEATKECQIRGLLLLRIRDEGRLTLSAHATIANAAIAYGNRILGRVEDKARADSEAKTESKSGKLSQRQYSQHLDRGQESHADFGTAPSLTALVEENGKLKQENQQLRLQIEQLEHVGTTKKKTFETSRWSELLLLRRSNQQLQFVLDAVEPQH